MDLTATAGVIWSYTRVFVLIFGTLTAAAFAVGSLAFGTWEWHHLALFFVAVAWIRASITLYNHRYFTHAAFEFTRLGDWTIRPLLAFGAAIGVQGPTTTWAKQHKRHHAHVDDWIRDPHSPIAPGGWLHQVWGFLWAHMFWLPNMKHDSRYDNTKGRDWLEHVFCNGLTYLLFGPLLFATIVWCLSGWLAVAWYFTAVCFTLHVTWAVNSVSHLWGSRPFPTKDHSVDCWWLAWLSPEFWHNGHHAFASSARFCHKWWQLLTDPEYLFIVFCSWLGPIALIRNISVPSAEQIARRQQGAAV